MFFTKFLPVLTARVSFSFFLRTSRNRKVLELHIQKTLEKIQIH